KAIQKTSAPNPTRAHHVDLRRAEISRVIISAHVHRVRTQLLPFASGDRRRWRPTHPPSFRSRPGWRRLRNPLALRLDGWHHPRRPRDTVALAWPRPVPDCRDAGHLVVVRVRGRQRAGPAHATNRHRRFHYLRPVGAGSPDPKIHSGARAEGRLRRTTK